MLSNTTGNAATLTRPEIQHDTPILVDRQAVRFLLHHRIGRLVTTDPITGEARITPVHYIPDSRGGFLTLLPADSEQINVLRLTGSAVMSVESRHGKISANPLDADGQPDRDAIRHVQAHVDVEILDDADSVRRVLSRQISSVLEPLPQNDKSDPLERAPAAAFDTLVALRLSITQLDVRFHARTYR